MARTEETLCSAIPKNCAFSTKFLLLLFLLRFLCVLLFKSFGCGAAALRLGVLALKRLNPRPSASIRGSISFGCGFAAPRSPVQFFGIALTASVYSLSQLAQSSF